jgi:hypothetical protein
LPVGVGLVFVALVIGLAASDRDRKKAALDNIQKILDIIHGMNPEI